MATTNTSFEDLGLETLIAQADDDALDFQTGLSLLEAIVNRIETPDTSLEHSLTLFEAGVRAADRLRERLESAERRIETLTADTAS